MGQARIVHIPARYARTIKKDVKKRRSKILPYQVSSLYHFHGKKSRKIKKREVVPVLGLHGKENRLNRHIPAGI